MSHHNPPSRTLNPAANSRFGLGSEESGLSAPLLTISGVVIQTPRARHAGHGMPFGLSPYSTAPYGNIGTVMTGFPPPPVMSGFGSDLLGMVDKDAAQANNCAKEHDPLRKKLAASMDVIIRTLGFPDGSQEGQRCYFRLGEILARADKNIQPLGWGYAGPSTNEPDKKGQEGTDFRSADNSKKKALGHQGRIEAEKKKSSGTGRMCQMSNLLKSTISVCDILATQFTGKSPEECKQTFSSMMQYYLSPDPKAAAWAKGMEFLPPGAEYSPPEALGGVKKAGLKKEKGALGIAGRAAGGLVSKYAGKAAGDALSKYGGDALDLIGLKDAKKKKKVLDKFTGDKGLSADSAKEAFAQIAEEALTSGDPPAAVEPAAAESATTETAAVPPPGAPSSKTGLIVLGAAAIGAFLLLKS